ncbi:uncharacterized protein LOC133192819 [Saccostrea echinata]|uniref:uncharacterized protein LOC133192819 n=1 Tax=Saccostrea echinata TaxID=191078 RepID=UPI002A7F9927|nr:uncharacterized protein LOC133192819 [Saccostrea echinata]
MDKGSFILNGCENLFECKECRSIRMDIKDLWYDLLCMSKPYSRKPVGSHGDGIVFNAGYTDEAFLLENTTVLQNGESNIPGIVNFLLDESSSSWGFCRLQPLPGLTFKNDIFIEEGDVKYLSSKRFINMCLRLSRKNSKIESSFIRTNGLSLAYVLPFKSWPECAKEWLNRERPRCWPSATLVSKIKDTACYCEPVANGPSRHPDLDWRISFAVAETLLIRSLDSAIFNFYQILKILAKEKIVPQSGYQDIISSYVIRTTLYWICENGLPNIISGGNFEFCLLIFIYKLENCVKDDFCPHYFVPGRNVFEASISPRSKGCLLECFGDIKADVFYSVLELPSLKTLKFVYKTGGIDISMPSSTEVKLNKEITALRFASTISYNVLQSGYAFEILENIETYFANCYEYSQIEKSFLKILFYPLAKATGTILYNNVVKTVDNKTMYCGIRLCKQLSLLGTKSDVISGRLSLATLQHLCGQYEKCIELTGSVLERIEPFSIYDRKGYGVSRNVDRLNAYTEIILSAPMPIEKKMQRAFLSDFEVFKEAPVIPSHLYIENEFFSHPPKVSSLPALVYLRFLRFLSFHEMKNESEKHSALEDLRAISYDEEYAGNSYLAFNMVGICEKICGNIPMAFRYFCQSVVISKRAKTRYVRMLV